ATSWVGRLLDGSGNRASLPSNAAGPGAKVACKSLRSEIARIAAPVARRNSSTALAGLLVIAGSALGELHLSRAVLQIDAEAALEILGHHRALQLVALVEERDAEGEADVAEDAGILGPGDDGARAHDGRDVAVDEAGAGQLGAGDHRLDGLAARLVVVARRLRQHDADLVLVRQVVQRRHDVPAVHLALVDLLRAVIEAGGVA